MSIESIVGTTLAAGGGGVMVAVANAFVNRRKRGIDVTEQIERVAGSMVDRVEKENEKLHEQRARDHRLLRELEAALESKVRADEERERWLDAYQELLAATFDEMRQSFAAHVQFDHDLVERLRAHGETDLPEPPPLILPAVPTAPEGFRRPTKEETPT